MTASRRLVFALTALHSTAGVLLSVCTNMNSCGRAGYGFGHKALEMLSVVADVSDGRFEVRGGSCLTRCSSGVNAKRLDDGPSALLTGLNSYGAVGAVAEELLGRSPKLDAVVASFRASADGDFATAVSAARQLVDGPPSYAVGDASWAGTEWTESFYSSELSVDDALRGVYGDGATVAATADGRRLSGRWAEDGSGGDFCIEMSDDLTSFAGAAQQTFVSQQQQ